MTAASVAMPIGVGTVLNGRYRIESFLGKGGMGEVFEARQLDLGRTVAVKVLSGVAGVKDRARFVSEAMATASLAHPHIVQVLELAYVGDVPYLVMERLTGSSLRDLLVRAGPLEPERARSIAVQMLGALDAAHHKRIHHRDIKPGNVFVVEGPGVRDFVKVLDFGIAKVVDDPTAPVTTTGTLLGTLAYIAPERLRGEPGDERADLYAVGLCLYEMIHGRRVFAGSGIDVMREILRGAPTIHGAFAPVVSRAIASDPSRRFRSAAEMRAALEAEPIMTGSSSPPAAGTAPAEVETARLGAGAVETRRELPAPTRAGTAPERAPQHAREHAAKRRPERSRLPLIVALVVVVIALFGAALFLAYTAGLASRPASRAPAAPATPAPSSVASASAPALAASASAPPVSPSPSSSSAPRVAPAPAITPRPAAGGRCMCIRPGRTVSLCPPSSIVLVPMCQCTNARGISLAKTVESAGDSRASAVRGAPGSPCQGFPTAIDPRESGTLTSCNFCEGTTRAYAGPSNAPCTGIESDGKTVATGVVFCD